MDYTDEETVAERLTEHGLGATHAEAVAEQVAAEAEHELGDAETLYEHITEAESLILDASLELVSGVETPAVDSEFVAMKSHTEAEESSEGGGGYTPLLLHKASEEKRVSVAPAMIPREPDKEGDVVATETVERAAWDFVRGDGGIDTDHNLIDGKGEVVESWVQKDERTYSLPGGGTRTYPAGTWMLGIKWRSEPWNRIKAGDIAGLSIYGTAEQVALGKNLEDPEFSEGDAVRWSSRGSPVHGRVAGIHEQFSPNPDVTITGDEGEAVYSIYEWDDSLATPEFQISPSEPNIAKPQSSLSESQRDMPPATDDNFNRVSESVGKAVTLPSPGTAQLLYPDQETAAEVAVDMGLGEPGDEPDDITHRHIMDGSEMYMPGETHERFSEAVAEAAEGETVAESEENAGSDTPQSVKGETPEQDGMGQNTDEGAERTLTDADAEAVAAKVREATEADEPRSQLQEKELTAETLLDIMAQAEPVDADAEELAEMLAPVMDGDMTGGDEMNGVEEMGEESDEDSDEEMMESGDKGPGYDEEEEEKSAGRLRQKGQRGVPEPVHKAQGGQTATGDPTKNRSSVLTETED